MKLPITITINGQAYEHVVEPRLLLVHFLRDVAGLTGTKIGCDTSQCGSCTVLLDDVAVKSCTCLAVQADGPKVTTIEGLAKDGELERVQNAFWSKHGLQCGFCTPGMVMTARELLRANPNPTRRADPSRPRRQHVPLHRLPEYRALRAARRRGRCAMSADERAATRFSAPASSGAKTRVC